MSIRVLTLSMLWLLASTAAGGDLDRARDAAKSLGTELKATLANALTLTGPVGAISACQQQAPVVTARLAQPDLVVGRTALRVRNPGNSASGWQRAVMEEWLRDLVSGRALDELEYFQADANGEFRYMKPIVTEAVCLVCHGRELDPALERAILAAYPMDKARGFELGEFRGAVVVESSQVRTRGRRD